MSERKAADSSPTLPAEALNGHAVAPPRAAPDEHAVPMDLPKLSTGAAAVITLVLVALFVCLFLLGWVPHSRRLARADAEVAENTRSAPIVEVVKPRVGARDDELLLPADVRANQMTAIFARASGYLKTLPPGIDIGAQVKAGQMIAEIDSPELDAQLEQAKASLEQARVAAIRAEQQYLLTESTLKRYESASLSNAIAQQDLDEKRSQQSVASSSLKEAQANLLVARASVKRLSEMQEFERVTAPFGGVITSRPYDAGALISPTDTGAGKELFRIEQVDVLRVNANVPQGYATDIRTGQTADLLVRNYPGRAFSGVVARSSGAIDPNTRTLLVEVDIPNPDGQLLPGMYGQLRFQCHRDQPPVIVPTSAFVFDAEGMRVAVLEGGRAKFRRVTLGRDFGAEAEVLTGLTGDDTVVNNPGALADGAEVTVKKR